MKLKITKVKPYRINFILDGLHYSLNEYEGDYRDYAALSRKELVDKKQYWDLEGVSFRGIVSMFEKPNIRYKRGTTFFQRYDIDKLEYFIREIIADIPLIQTTEYLIHHKKEVEIAINNCQRNLQQYNDELELIKQELCRRAAFKKGEQE